MLLSLRGVQPESRVLFSALGAACRNLDSPISLRYTMSFVEDADFVYPPLRRGSRRVSSSNPDWAETGQVSEGEDGRKTGDVGE